MPELVTREVLEGIVGKIKNELEKVEVDLDLSEPNNLYYNATLKERTYDGVTLIIREGTHLYFNGECTADDNDFYSPSPYEIPLIIGQEYEVELKVLSGSYSFTPDQENYFKFELWNGDNYVAYNRVYDGEQFFDAPFVFTASQEVITQYGIDVPPNSTFTDLEVELIIRERPYIRTGVDADEITTSKLKIGNYVLSHDNINDTLDINYGG